ncbi:MAG: hypothetical protein HY741_21965 [Chloroflexi bacterium]|nr:hypothetical protein [Chloroflexota bacterium]
MLAVVACQSLAVVVTPSARPIQAQALDPKPSLLPTANATPKLTKTRRASRTPEATRTRRPSRTPKPINASQANLTPTRVATETATPVVTARQGDVTTEPDLKVAFIGDSGNGSEFEQVLELVKAEGADLVLHQGDFDYEGQPDALDAIPE